MDMDMGMAWHGMMGTARYPGMQPIMLSCLAATETSEAGAGAACDEKKMCRPYDER